jgi:hypothetical protein
MNWRLRVLQLYVPAWARKRMLGELFRYTAVAFGRKAPTLKGWTPDESLLRYAVFTRAEAEKALQDGRDLEALRERLYHSTYQMGHRLAKGFGIHSQEEVMTMAGLLYRGLDIDFCGTPQGEVTISRCFFSDYYSGPICRLVSALDSGLLAGLAGGGQLTFSARITEGQSCCRAQFVREEVNP